MIEQNKLEYLANEQPSLSNWGLVASAESEEIELHLASLVSYQQRWETDITSRFREAKKRFPEFFPCFELLHTPSKGLQYSIYFHPLTRHAQALIDQAPIFPHAKEFKPIEKLWREDGLSELDILFERFPTQLTLSPPKQHQGERVLKRVVELVRQRWEMRLGRLLGG